MAKFLIDTKFKKKQEDITASYRVAALCRLAKGNNYDQDDVDKFWQHPNPYKYSPAVNNPKLKKISIKKLKWYIWNNTEELAKYFSWNHNFFLGLCSCGVLKQNLYSLPVFRWSRANKHVLELFEKSPYHCDITTCSYRINSMGLSAALCLKPNEESMEYMAGVLATGQIKVIDGKTYVQYTKRVAEIFRRWKVPIDIEYKKGCIELYYISPIWPTLLKKYMPLEESIRWKRYANPANSEEFAFILWRIYVNKDPISGVFPYLKGRKTLFNKYITIKNFEQKWLDYKLVELDPRFQTAILEWKKEYDLNKTNCIIE